MNNNVYTIAPRSNKSWFVLVLLSFFFRFLGFDRFYAGRISLGLIKLFLVGGIGIWAFVDFILALLGRMKDSDGVRIRP